MTQEVLEQEHQGMKNGSLGMRFQQHWKSFYIVTTTRRTCSSPEIVSFPHFIRNSDTAKQTAMGQPLVIISLNELNT